MNSASTLAILVLLLFAYCAPIQGNVYPILEAAFKYGLRYTSSRDESLDLVKSFPDAYEIQQTSNDKSEPDIAVKFRIEGIDTVIGKELVLRTNDNWWLQMEFISARDLQRLFTTTTSVKLGKKLYSYNVSAVYEFLVGRIQDDVSISGFKYATTGNPLRRHIIHPKHALDNELEVRLLWTEKDFDLLIYDSKSLILTLCTKPASGRYRYFLVRFVNDSDLANWLAQPGRDTADYFPSVSQEVHDYFDHIMNRYKKNRDFVVPYQFA